MASENKRNKPEADGLEDQSRRDFACSALAAGALLIAPSAPAAAQTPKPARAATESFSKYIYFYYLTKSAGTHPRVRAYFVEDQDVVGNITTRTEALVADAKSGKLTPLGFEIGSILWCRKSYIIVVLDYPGLTLQTGKGVSFEEHVAHSDGSYTFKEGKDIALTGMTGWYCRNHLKKINDVDLTSADSEQFDVRVNIPGLPDDEHSRGHVDTGTNTGPPP